MDINNLQAFIEVADKKSFSRSAESLKLTQPAVSKRIAALEAELASRLFDRVGRRVHLTEAGKVLLPSALKISSEISRIENELCTMGKEVGGKLAIGVADHVCLDRLTPILKSYKQNYVNVEIDLQFCKSADLLNMVESGRLDVCLCAVSDTHASAKSLERFVRTELWKERLQVMTEKNHPLAHSGSVTVKDLSRYPGVLPQKNSAIRNSIDRIMLSNNVEATVSMEAVDFSTAKSMATIGLGWACLPKAEVADTNDTLVHCDVADIDLWYSVALVRNPNRSMSRASQAFIDELPANLH